MTPFRLRQALVATATAALAGASFVAASPSASASTPTSLLCSGYRACSRSLHDERLPAARSAVVLDDVRRRQLHQLRRLRRVHDLRRCHADLRPRRRRRSGHRPRAARCRRQRRPHRRVPWRCGPAGAAASPSPATSRSSRTSGRGAAYIDISQQHMSDDPDGFDWTRIYRDPRDNEWQDWPEQLRPLPRRARVRSSTACTSGSPVRRRTHSRPPAAGSTRFGIRGSTCARQGSSGRRVRASRRSCAASRSPTRRASGDLETAGSDGDPPVSRRREAGTNPSITAVLDGYEVAVQSSTGQLVTIGAAGTRIWAPAHGAGTRARASPRCWAVASRSPSRRARSCS